MAEKIFVTDAQVKAAQMLIDRDRALGRETDEATRKIAGQGHAVDTRPQAPPAERAKEDAAEVPPAAFSFWDALSQDEREGLGAVASWRTFAAGTTLMQEGERADDVIVILGGRAKVSVRNDGRERVLAVRGLGQLIGERGALRVSVRSATVTALEMVWGLVVPTADFATFVSDHPRILQIVETQLYSRLTEAPTGYALEERDQSRRDLTARESRFRPELASAGNCTVMCSDIVNFSSTTRTDGDRALIREALFNMTNAALEGIPGVRMEDRGDGILTVIPSSVPTAEVMDRLLKELPAALEQYNNSQPESAQFQLRLAVNVGPVISDSLGVSGEAIILAARLLEAPHFKEAVATSAATLGIITSPFVYEAVVKPSPDLNEVASYLQIPVEVKEFNTTAWMKVISRDPVPAP